MKERIFIFTHKGQELERADWDVQISDIELIKSCLSFTRNINYDDIDMETVEVFKPELSNLFVRDGGALMRNGNQTNPSYVNGLLPGYDLHHEELLDEFLDSIFKKDFDNAIIFS